MKKTIALCLMLATLISCMSLFVSANPEDDIQPYFSNVNTASIDFAITENGLAGVSVTYTGIRNVTTHVKCEIYLQKKTLGLFWNKVNIGTTDNVWIDTSTEYYGDFFHSIQLSDKGTYRAVVKLTFSGTGGDPDIIEDKFEKKY